MRRWFKALRNQKGFTLLEILIATSLFAASATVILNGVLTANQYSIRDRNLLQASMLANNKMIEIENDIQLQISRGGFPDDKAESGKFSGTNERYSWDYEIKKVEIPLAKDGGGEGQNAQMLGILKTVMADISRAVRELKVRVTWIEDDEKNPEEVVLTTHIVRLKK